VVEVDVLWGLRTFQLDRLGLLFFFLFDGLLDGNLFDHFVRFGQGLNCFVLEAHFG